MAALMWARHEAGRLWCDAIVVGRSVLTLCRGRWSVLDRHETRNDPPDEPERCGGCDILLVDLAARWLAERSTDIAPLVADRLARGLLDHERIMAVAAPVIAMAIVMHNNGPEDRRAFGMLESAVESYLDTMIEGVAPE